MLIFSLLTTGKASFALHLISLAESHPTISQRAIFAKSRFIYEYLNLGAKLMFCHLSPKGFIRLAEGGGTALRIGNLI